MPKENTHGLPEMFRPLLWSYRWEDMDPEQDKEDIILHVVNDGNLKHWRWIINQYGKSKIKRVLEKRLSSEIYPESRHLARLLFGVNRFRDVR